MKACQLRKGLVVGRLEVFDVQDDRSPYIPFNRIGVLFFDLLNRRYVRATFKRSDVVDPNELPEWVNRAGCPRF